MDKREIIERLRGGLIVSCQMERHAPASDRAPLCGSYSELPREKRSVLLRRSMGEYKILWTDMHSNLHHERIGDLPLWLDHMKKLMDFWPIAYYPFGMVKNSGGLAVEDRYPLDEIAEDWEFIRRICRQANEEGFPMFMGYEWQGAGLDGDHNVFFKNDDQDMADPLRYQELRDHFLGTDAIAIPHHMAYQLGHRGKNWETQDDSFSPFAEIYSSHGSSESDVTPLDMNRHVHMGPRTGATCAERGWERGCRFGVIASGDNHSCPGVYGFGYCAVLAKSNTKEAIWDAFVNRRVYGVSKDRILLAYTLDGKPMGSLIRPRKEAELELEVTGSSALDRIEILKDQSVVEMIPHTSTWEGKKLEGRIRFKFQLELGWGPDRRIFPDIESRKWEGSLSTPGTLLSVEKCWSNFGQDLRKVTEKGCEFSLTTYKTTATGKWMGPSGVTTEGFIFEIEDDIHSSVTLVIGEETYELSIKEMLRSSRVLPLLDEAAELLKERFGFTDFYRSDSWWHNCYKIKVGQATPEIGYHTLVSRKIDTTDCENVRVRVWQKNGGVAWSSPIFIERQE